jgi:hypothetical protein
MIFSSNPHDLIHWISPTCTLIGHRCHHHHHLNIKLQLYLIGLAGPVGFDPTTTGSGGLRFFLKEQRPILTRRRAPSAGLNLLIYETYRPQMTSYSLNSFSFSALAHPVYAYKGVCTIASFAMAILYTNPYQSLCLVW